jgi:hypothetical protein
MSRQSPELSLIVALILCLIAIPASAVVQEVTVKGMVGAINDPKSTLTINNPAEYGCTYPASGTSVCTWTPFRVSALTGTVPDTVASSVFKAGDTIVGTSTGGAGDTWITLAKLYGSRPNEEFITDIVGEPGTLPQPLIGDYMLDLATAPDCSVCSGQTCAAASSHITVLSSGRVVTEKVLSPGETLSFNGRNDGSSVTVTFVRGQAAAGTCPKAPAYITPGIQPVSDYIVKIIPPVSFVQNNIRTATTTRPDEARSTTISTMASAATSVPASTNAPSIPTATKSGSFPIVSMGALCLAGIAFALRKTE